MPKKSGGGGHSSLPQLPVDTLMYMCLLHASVHRYVCEPGIKLYFDIGLLARLNVNWHRVLRMAEEDQYTIRVKTAARLAFEILHAPIPQWVIEDHGKERNTSKRIDCILHQPDRELKQRLKHLELLRVEALSDGISVPVKLIRMLCPDRLWIQQKSGRPVLLGYFKHILKDLGG